MLTRELRAPDGTVVRRFSPSSAQRVFSPSTCATMRGMLTAVVDSGTAKAARVPGYAIAGKTGTAQKYDASVRGYGKGLYLSSFAGFAPAESPSLVGVVVIDEPRGKHYYGGDVAAPIFKRVIVDLLGLPSDPLGRPATQIAARPPAPAPVTVPDLRLLPPRAAEGALASRSLHGRFLGEGPRVLAQSPPAGVAVERGARVDMWLAAGTDSLETLLPDVVGLTVREAVRELSRRQVPARIVGHGAVVQQSPAPGTPLPLAGSCVLRCEPRRPGEISAWLAPRADGAAPTRAGVTP